MAETITRSELKKLIADNKIRPDQLFSKEEILNDPEIQSHIATNLEIEKEIEKDEAKKEEDSMIPDNKKPASKEKKKPVDDDSEDGLIPD